MQQLKIHHLQHVPFEGLGLINSWIDEHQHQLTSTRFYDNEMLPNIEDIDVLIITGGPMSIHDEAEFPWLKAEKQFVKQAIDANKKIIGICLGAQLIADVLEAKVYPNKNKEIGWFKINKVEEENTEENQTTLAHFFKTIFDQQTVLHWHGETFELPENTIHLAKSDACLHQAFLYKNTVLGLQFHIEMNETSIHTIIENCRAELIPSEYIQTEEEIKQKMKNYVDENKNLLFKLLDEFMK
ncbi:MAG: type 1 glutamine amidotransferase [Chitinophagales bacterium]